MAAFDGNITRPKVTAAGFFNPLAPNVAVKMVTAGAIFAAALFYDGAATVPKAIAESTIAGFTGSATLPEIQTAGTILSGGAFSGSAKAKAVQGSGVFYTFTFATNTPLVATAGAWAQGGDFTGQGRLSASNTEGAIFGAVLGSTYQPFVVNTKTMGAALYDNYSFNSLFKGPDGHYYGCSDAGIFRLTGKKDNGNAINASVISGVSDFTARVKKYFPDAYLALRSEGTMEFTITVDENKRRTYQVEAREGTQGSHTKRRELARGVSGRYAQIEIHNVAGCDFDLQGVDLIYEPTRRT